MDKPSRSCPTKASRKNSGFTLVELVVVIAIMGIVALAVSNGVMALLRTNVQVSARVDDNRDLLALATWLPADVNSTPATTGAGTGAEVGDLPSGCSTGAPGVGLLRLTWSEKQGSSPTNTYRVSYRAMSVAGAATILRVSCTNFGAPSTATASKPLPLLVNGTLPVSVTATGTKVTLSVIQHPGTAGQKTIQIEAASRNPALATLPPPPPPPPPPVMTLDASDVNAGSAVNATLSKFAAGENITFFVDFTYSSDVSMGPIATAVADSAGAVASVALLMPLSTTNGIHQIFAVGDAGGFAAQSLFVHNGTISLNSNAVLAGGTIGIDVANFDKGDIVTFLLDGNTVLGSVTIVQNTKTTDVIIPLQTSGGLHVVTATASSGRRAISDGFTVQPVFTLSPTSVLESLTTSAVVYGFRAGEGITFTLDSPNGTLLGSGAADINGYNTTTLTIPAFTAPGAHTVIATGDDITSISAAASVGASVREYVVTPTTPTITAGGNATLTLQATINGVSDPTLNGTVAITVSGANSSPNGTAPAAPPTTATFTNGVGSINVNLVNALPTTITVADGIRTGRSTSITVNAATTTSIAFAVACPTPVITQKWTSGFTTFDTYGNPVSGQSVTMTFSPPVGSATTVASLDWSGWTTVTANTSYRSVTDGAGNTPSFTATGPNGNSHKPSTTVTATANGYSVACTVSS